MINPIAQKQIDYIAERCKEIKPLVLINCLTYNHEQYLKDALEGFIMQKTTFPFIAIVHEDASNDGTARVLKEYTDKYPDIIFPIFEEENQYQKKDLSLREIYNAYMESSGAKYIAMCEGDDYWTDPEKLQKQVDFLEKNSDYTMCCHNAIIHYENRKKEDHIFRDFDSGEFKKELFWKDGWNFITASFTIRANVLNNPYYLKCKESKKMYVGDVIIVLSSASQGKIYYSNEVLCTYRNNPTNWSHTKDNRRILKFIDQYVSLNKIFKKKFSKILKEEISKASIAGLQYIRGGDYKIGLKIIKKSLYYSPIRSTKKIIKHLIYKIKSPQSIS